MIVLKKASEIEALREAGRVVALAHQAMWAAAAPGVTLKELDTIAADVLAENGATSAFLGYQPHFATSPFPGVICASVNDQIVHGIPTDYALQPGDVLSIDFGAIKDGWVGDAAQTHTIGEARSQADLDLIAATNAALEAGIETAVAGNRIGDIGAAVSAIAKEHGYGMPEGWGGHGVGREMHEDPSVPNEGKAGRGLRLKPGLVIAIEPMFIAGGTNDYELADDGWTVLTTDGSNAAHSEHTIAITEDGPRILTLP